MELGPLTPVSVDVMVRLTRLRLLFAVTLNVCACQRVVATAWVSGGVCLSRCLWCSPWCPDVPSLLLGWLLVGAVSPSPSHKCVKRLAWPVALLLLGWAAARCCQGHPCGPPSPPQPSRRTKKTDNGSRSSTQRQGRIRWDECCWVNGSGGMSNKGSLLHPTLT